MSYKLHDELTGSIVGTHQCPAFSVLFVLVDRAYEAFQKEKTPCLLDPIFQLLRMSRLFSYVNIGRGLPMEIVEKVCI